MPQRQQGDRSQADLDSYPLLVVGVSVVKIRAVLMLVLDRLVSVGVAVLAVHWRIVGMGDLHT